MTSVMPADLETALLITVPDLPKAIRDIRLRLDPGAALGVPEHVTVMYPFLHPDDVGEAVVDRIEKISSETAGFEFSLTEVQWFGEAVVWLAPCPEDPFRRLSMLVEREFGTRQYGGAYDEITPHLTIGHAQLISDLLGSFTPPARIVLLGSNIYRAGRALQMVGVQPAEWRDPFDLARRAPADSSPSVHAAAVAYSTSKLAILYYAHELQRRVGDGIGRLRVRTRLHARHRTEPDSEPGRPGDDAGPAASPRGARPSRSGPALASVVLDDRWAHLRDGAFVAIDKETDVAPLAHGIRERPVRHARGEVEPPPRLWSSAPAPDRRAVQRHVPALDEALH